MKKKWIVAFALLAVVLAAVVMFQEPKSRTQEFSPRSTAPLFPFRT